VPKCYHIYDEKSSYLSQSTKSQNRQWTNYAVQIVQYGALKTAKKRQSEQIQTQNKKSRFKTYINRNFISITNAHYRLEPSVTEDSSITQWAIAILTATSHGETGTQANADTFWDILPITRRCGE
jgi:hypothetical protein